MLLLQHFHNLSDPQCEAMIKDRISWRKFIGIGLNDPVPDGSTLVRFRQRMVGKSIETKLLSIVNEQLKAKGILIRKATIIDTSLIEASTRRPKQGEESDDEDASYTIKNDEIHHGYKAHVAVDTTTHMICDAEMTTTSTHDSQAMERLIDEDDESIYADKAYAGAPIQKLLKKNNTTSYILKKAQRGKPLTSVEKAMNTLYSRTRVRVEKIFGYWKRTLGYRRVRYRKLGRNRLELEIKSICWNLTRWLTLSQPQKTPV